MQLTYKNVIFKVALKSNLINYPEMHIKPNLIKYIIFTLLSLFAFALNVFAQDPTVDPINDIYLVESSSPAIQTVTLTGINGTTPLTVSAVSNNTNLIPNPDVNYNTSDTTLTFTPVADTSGIATITVTITNGNSDTADSTFVVYVNGKPNFTSGNTASFAENSSGTVIDINTTDPEDSTVTYSLQSGVSDNNLFSVNSTTGEISFTNSPDYENPADANNDNDYIIRVAATDNGVPAASDTLQITITVTDVDEAPVAVADTFATSEDVTLTVPARGVLINDSDPEGATTTASIVDSASHATITLNSDGSFTFEPDTNYYGLDQFTYRAADQTSHQSNTATVTISVAAVNDAPVITSNDTVFIDEGETAVTTLTARDEENDNITFSITGGADTDDFSITTTGNITFNTAPDYENPQDQDNDNTYNITVIATDDGTPSTSSQTFDIAIIVRDVNESPPKFSSAETDTINENQTSVLTVIAADEENSNITYSLLEGANDNDNFTIGESDGVLTFITAPDYENPTDANSDNNYIVTVIASDNQSAPLTATQTLTVTVKDVNEGPPVFNDFPTNISVEENQINVLTANATDPEGNTVTYSLPDDNTTDNSLFAIDVNTGVLTFRNAPDFENPINLNGDNNYIALVVASDNQQSPLTTSQNVTVTVTDVNEPPVANNDTLQTNEDTQLTITESELLTNDPDPENNTLSVTYGNDISNGTITDNNDGTYIYVPNSNFNGVDRFTYTVSDKDFTSSPATVVINVTPVNDPPNFMSDDTVHVNENMTGTVIDVNAIDPEGDNVSYELTSGYIDNSLFTLTTDGILTFNDIPDYEHPIDQGNDNYYSVNVTATDDAASPESSTQTITIIVDDVNEAPEFTSVSDLSIPENQLAVLTVTTDDPENNSIVYSLPGTGDNSFFTIDNNGDLAFRTSPDYESPADADINNIYVVTVNATDDGTPQQTSQQIINVTITDINEPPVANNDTYDTKEDTELTVNADSALLVNDSDPEGTSLTITNHTNPAHGTISNFNNDVGSFTYNPDPDYNGNDTISYTVSDGNNTSIAWVYFIIGGVNDAPVAHDNTYTIHEDGILTEDAASGILANDNDPDGNSLTVEFYSDVKHGTINLNTNDGSFVYTPDHNFNGNDTLTYTASDGRLDSDTATVIFNVTPVNDPPVAVNDTATIEEGGTVVINIVSNDSDIDGTLDLTSVTITNVSNGTIDNNTNGQITFTHDGSETTSAGFSYTVNDNNGSTSNLASVVISVTPVNDIPVVTDITDLSVNEGSSVNINLIDHFSDNDGTPDQSSIVISDTINGSCTDNGDGTITFTHDGSETTTAGFTYTINDDQGATSNKADVILTVNPVNDAPVFISSDTVTIEENQANVMAIETTDAENNTIEYSLSTGNDNALFAINNTTGILSFSSLPDFENPLDFDRDNRYIVTVIATDNGTPSPQTSSQTITVTVTNVNETPVVSDDNYNIFEDDTLVTTLDDGILENDSDPDGDVLTITIQRNVAHGTINMNVEDGTFTYIPEADYSGSDSFTYTVYDGAINSSIATATINITEVNDPPVALDDTNYEVDEDSYLYVSTSEGVLSNDTDPDNTDLKVSLQDSVSHGSLNLYSDGSFQYTPTANYNGTDVFTYTISDGLATSNKASVTITVNAVNDPPVVQDDSYQTNEDVVLNVSQSSGVLNNDSDPDNDILTASVQDSVSHGTILLNANGSFTYTPDTNYYGTDQFTYVANDGTVSSPEVTVSLTIISQNDNPVAHDDAATVNEGESTTINIVANDVDVDGTLDYSTINISNVTNGSYTNNGNGTITFTHDGSETTTAGFSYTIEDDQGAISNTAQVLITVVQQNDIPVANNDEATVNEGDSVKIDIVANDTDADGTLDNSSIIFSNIENGECINNNDGTVTFVHDGSETTSASFSYTINDDVGATSNVANVSITVIPQNDPPVTVDDEATVNEGDTITINIVENDYDPDGTLNLNSILLGNITNGSTVDNKDGTITFAHNGSETTTAGFSYIISDNNGAASRLTNVSITVNPVNDPPVFTSGQEISIDEDQLEVLTVTATDAENNTIAFSLTDVDDNSLFTINSSTGDLSFKKAPDYEKPSDADKNNIYVVTVTATDNGSPAQLTSQQINVTVKNVNEAPDAIEDTYNTQEDDTLNVAAPGVIANDTDQEGDALSAYIENNVSHGNLVFRTDGSFSYIPETNYNGTDEFSYYLNDKTSNSDTVNVIINIQPQNDAPVAYPDSYNSEEDKTLIINSPGVLTNDVDIDNNSLTAVLITSPDNGTLDLSSDGSFTYQPNQNFAGLDTFTYMANDGNLTSDPVEVIINIGETNDAPVSLDDAYTIDEDKTLTTVIPGVLYNDSDPDNNYLSAILESSVSHGSLTLNINGSFTYTPENNFNGNDNFTYRASDGQATSNISTVNITVLPVNDPPVASDDYFYTAEDIPDNINVISNDSDPFDIEGGIASNSIKIISPPKHGTALISGDRINYSPYLRYYGNDTLKYTVFDTGYPLPALSDTAFVFIQVARRHPLAVNDTVATNEDVSIDINVLQNDQDIDIDPTTVTIGTPPSHGAISVDPATGIITYTPDLNYFGLTENGEGDEFTYTVKDMTGLLSNTANVIIDILPVPDPPVTTNVIRSTYEDVAVSISVDEVTSDPDNDIDYTSIEFIKLPTNGSVENNSTNKEIVYTPDPGFSGNDSLTFRVTDLQGNISNTSEIIITVSNEAPNANNDAYSINEDQTVEFNVLLNDNDPQNNIVPDSLKIISVPLHGIATVNGSSGTIIYTPEKDYFGDDNLTYKITDATNYSDQAQVSITITPVNDPPVAVDDNISTQEDQSVQIDILNNDFDIDNQIDSSSVSIFKAPLHGQISFDATTYLLNYIPELNYNGDDSLVYEVADVSGASAQGIVHITITPVEDSPVPQNDNLTTNEETEIIADIVANDIDVEDDIDPCSITIINMPSHGMITTLPDPSCGSISYTPDVDFLGTDQFTYQISDTTGLTGQAIVYITVNNTPDPPVAGDDNYTITEDSTLVMNVLLNDVDADNNIDSSKISILTFPSNGSVEIANKRIIYVPASNYNGTDQFEYMVCDSTNLCDSAYVYINITPVNDPPIAVDDYDTAVKGPVRTNVAENDRDIDDNLDLFSIVIVEQPQHGSAQVENGTGYIVYTPDADFLGNDQYKYRICDTHNACDTATVFITVTSGNEPPASRPDRVTTEEDTPVNISPLSNDSDPDDNMDISTLSIVTEPVNGTATLTSDQIEYVPSGNYYGNDIIVYGICDSGDPSLCSTDTIFITITPVNDDPVAVPIEAETSDGEVIDINVLSYCTDADNDPLTVTISEYTPDITGTVSVNDDGSIHYVARESIYCTTEQIIYKVCDTSGACDTASIFVALYPVDSDGDNIPDHVEGNIDPDNDGIPNYLDDDSDGDNIPDYIESGITDPCSGTLADTDGDNIDDFLDTDSDNDGVPDIDEGTEDCDNDGVPNYKDPEDDCVERLDVPDTFSPNGDGINDYFVIPGARELHNDELYIYNRWGGLVYHSKDYDSSWDGNSSSSMFGKTELEEGTYFYIYKPGNTLDVFKGTVYLKR